MPRNPKWTRDEIILTLDFYFQHYPKIPEKHSKEIQGLSDLLRSLSIRLGQDLADTYRNSNGVYMKLMNFHHFNDEHPADGLKGGSKLDEDVFHEFSKDRHHLSEVAKAIKECLNTNSEFSETDIDDASDLEAQEGRLLTRVHRYRERDRTIVAAKKSAALKKFGKIECECCGFNFEDKYGSVGSGFIECHHTKPISTCHIP